MESSLSAVAFLLAFSLAAPIASQSVIKIGRKSYEAQLYEVSFHFGIVYCFEFLTILIFWQDLLFYYNKIARPVKNSNAHGTNTLCSPLFLYFYLQAQMCCTLMLAPHS